MKSLLAQLGAVCEVCSTWSEPGVGTCACCGKVLEVVALLHGRPAAPPAPQAHARIPGPQTHARTPGPPPPPADAAAPQPRRTPTWPPYRTPPPPEPEAPCAACGLGLPISLSFCPSCGARVITTPPPELALEPGRVRLVHLRGLPPTTTPWLLADEEVTVGREGCAFCFAGDDTVPPHAATFRFRCGRLFLRDVGGANVFVRMRRPETIAPGSLFALGDQLLRFAGTVPPPRPGAPFLGSPPPEGETVLRIDRIHAGGVVGAAWLRPAPVRIGRSAGDLLLPDDPFVSFRHCELDAAPEGDALLRDLGSSNGTFLHLAAGGERELAAGDTVRIGRNVMRVEKIASTR